MANRHVYESGGADVFAPKNAVAPRPVFTNASIPHGRTTPIPLKWTAKLPGSLLLGNLPLSIHGDYSPRNATLAVDDGFINRHSYLATYGSMLRFH